MALRIVNFTWNTVTGNLRAIGTPIYLKRQEPVRFIVTTSAQIVDADDLSLVLRADGEFDNAPLLTLTGWEQVTPFVWFVEATISSDEIDTLLAVNQDESDDIKVGDIALDIRAFDADATLLATSDTLESKIKNAQGQDSAEFIEDGGGA